MKKLNCKVICKESHNENSMVVGKTYQFVNGQFQTEGGRESSIYTSVDDFHKRNMSEMGDYPYFTVETI